MGKPKQKLTRREADRLGGLSKSRRKARAARKRGGFASSGAGH